MIKGKQLVAVQGLRNPPYPADGKSQEIETDQGILSKNMLFWGTHRLFSSSGDRTASATCP